MTRRPKTEARRQLIPGGVGLGDVEPRFVPLTFLHGAKENPPLPRRCASPDAAGFSSSVAAKLLCGSAATNEKSRALLGADAPSSVPWPFSAMAASRRGVGSGDDGRHAKPPHHEGRLAPRPLGASEEAPGGGGA